jgi:ABC-type multidrug transport system ATPase subunit
MDEAMRCDRIALIQNGSVLAVDTPQRVREGFTGKMFTAKSGAKYKLLIALRNYPLTATAYPFGDSVHITFKNNIMEEDLLSYLENAGLNDVTIRESPAGIEDRFLELMEKR